MRNELITLTKGYTITVVAQSRKGSCFLSFVAATAEDVATSGSGQCTSHLHQGRSGAAQKIQRLLGCAARTSLRRHEMAAEASRRCTHFDALCGRGCYGKCNKEHEEAKYTMRAVGGVHHD